LQAATTLNDAFRVLKQPLRRAEALLALGGVTITENERLESDLLMEIMELRERLDDAHAGRDAGTARTIADDVRTRRDAAADDIARLFAAAPVALEEIKRRLILIRYFDRLLEAADAEIGALALAAPARAEGV
jgi:molecular chaperone HscB